MLKLADLRAHLAAAVPNLGRDPEKFIVMATAGRITSSGTQSLSFEYAYTAQLYVLDYDGHADAVIVPLLAWAKLNQPELFANPDKWPQGIRFNAEYLTTSTIDLAIEIDLTERVIVGQRPGATAGELQAEHLPEPPQIGVTLQAEHWTLWVNGEQIAEWNIAPR